MESSNKNSKTVSVLYYAAAGLMPGIFLFNLYNRNYAENLIFFTHVLVLAGILAVAGLLLFFLLRWVTGSIEGALLISCAFWLCFWLFHAVLSRAQRVLPALSDAGLMIIMGTCIVLAAVCFRQFKPPFDKIRPAFNALALCMAGLFLFNLFPAVSNQIILSRARADMPGSDGSKPFSIKRDFVVDSSLPHPNIHWIHVDGVMSLNTVEDFWGGDYGVFRDDIASMGFVLNEDAVLTAGYTYSALAAMLSPEFYDTFFGALIARHEGELRAQKGSGMADDLAQAGLTYEDNIIPSLEVLNAFIAAGYTPDIRNMDEYMPDYSADRWMPYDRFYNSDLPKLLSLTTPLSLPGRYKQVAAVDEDVNWTEVEADMRPDELFAQPSVAAGVPRFVWYGIHEAHMDNAWLYDPDMHEVDATAIHLYPLLYNAALSQALDLAGLIIEADPDAVIVIQSDHGFHMVPTQGALVNMGYDAQFILDMNYSVLSAVRIPEVYGGVDEPIDPLNISRELVNRFVGANYEIRD